jgi:cytochrome b6-f complex iron-sulfur subunit
MPSNTENRAGAAEPGNLDRRSVLRLAGLAVIGAGAPGCGNQMGVPPTGPVAGGNTSALAVGGLVVMGNVVVGRDENGVYAMSAVCTHAGCLLGDTTRTIAAGLSCPCHGSTFDGDGNVTRGPAGVSLQHYQVTIATDGSITVDGAQPVAASARTPVG